MFLTTLNERVAKNTGGVLSVIISENNAPQPCLSLSGCVSSPRSGLSQIHSTQKDPSEKKLGSQA